MYKKPEPHHGAYGSQIELRHYANGRGDTTEASVRLISRNGPKGDGTVTIECTGSRRKGERNSFQYLALNLPPEDLKVLRDFLNEVVE